MVMRLVEFVKPVAQLKAGCTRRALVTPKVRDTTRNRQGKGGAQNEAQASDSYIPLEQPTNRYPSASLRRRERVAAPAGLLGNDRTSRWSTKYLAAADLLLFHFRLSQGLSAA